MRLSPPSSLGPNRTIALIHRDRMYATWAYRRAARLEMGLQLAVAAYGHFLPAALYCPSRCDCPPEREGSVKMERLPLPWSEVPGSKISDSVPVATPNRILPRDRDERHKFLPFPTDLGNSRVDLYV